jgi:predicted PurR-regulated permease PerM
MTYRAMGSLGQCPPEAARRPAKDPCAVRYIVDLPVLGEEEVEVPITQLTNDILSSATRQLPSFLPKIYKEVTPYVDQIKTDIQDEVEDILQNGLDRTLRPEIEAQKAQLLSDINRELNKYLMIVLGLTAAVYAANFFILKRKTLI